MNVGGNRDLLEVWTGFTQFTMLYEKPQRVYVLRGAPDKGKQHQGQIVLGQKYGRRRQKQFNEERKARVDDRKGRSSKKQDGKETSTLIDLDDAEIKETIMNTRKRLEIPMEASIFCKIRKSQRKETCDKRDIRKS